MVEREGSYNPERDENAETGRELTPDEQELAEALTVVDEAIEAVEPTPQERALIESLARERRMVEDAAERNPRIPTALKRFLGSAVTAISLMVAAERAEAQRMPFEVRPGVAIMHTESRANIYDRAVKPYIARARAQQMFYHSGRTLEDARFVFERMHRGDSLGAMLHGLDMAARIKYLEGVMGR